MRWKMMSVGICSTNCSSPVSTRRLTRMLVPKPKKAFQSPGVQSLGVRSMTVPFSSRRAGAGEGAGEGGAVADPTEDSALGLDHLEADPVELRKVGGAGVADGDAAVATVVSFPDRGVHAHLGR